jgi:hypothetical protein
MISANENEKLEHHKNHTEKSHGITTDMLWGKISLSSRIKCGV